MRNGDLEPKNNTSSAKTKLSLGLAQSIKAWRHQRRRNKLAKVQQQIKRNQEWMLDELVDSIYSKRWRIVRLNFWRGLAFGLGSALGGTILLAFLIWLSTKLIDWFPVLGNFVQEVMEYASQHK